MISENFQGQETENYDKKEKLKSNAEKKGNEGEYSKTKP